MTTIARNTSVACSLGQEVHQFIQNAINQDRSLRLHIIGRALLAGTALAGTIEMISRLAFYCLGQVGAVLTFYQSETLNAFIKNQAKVGFSAAIITSASLFSLLSPQFFTELRFVAEAPAEIAEARPAPHLRRESDAISEIVKLPFQMVALCFKLPFYLMQLTLSLALLPVRVALIPMRLVFENLRIGNNDHIRLDLI